MKNNLQIEKTLLDDTTVQVVEKYTQPRYSARIFNNCQEMCEEVAEGIKSDCKIYVKPTGNFSSLLTFEVDREVFTGKTLAEDLAIYQKLLDKEFGKGKYEAFVLGAYIHSGTSFSINKCGNTVCRFDSSNLGFIGLPVKEEDTNYGNSAAHAENVAQDLTDAWEGNYHEYQVVDNLTDDVVDSICTADYDEQNKFSAQAKEKYNVDFEDVEVIY